MKNFQIELVTLIPFTQTVVVAAETEDAAFDQVFADQANLVLDENWVEASTADGEIEVLNSDEVVLTDGVWVVVPQVEESE